MTNLARSLIIIGILGVAMADFGYYVRSIDFAARTKNKPLSSAWNNISGAQRTDRWGVGSYLYE